MKIKHEFDEKESKFVSAMEYATAIESDIFLSTDFIPFVGYNDRVKFFKEVAAHLGVAASFCEEEILPGGMMEI